MKHRLAFLSLLWLAGMLCAFAAPGTLDSRQTISDGIGYRKIPVGKTGLQFPRLTQYRDPSIVSAVNREIDQLTATMGCEEQSKDNTYEVRSEVTYAAKDIFSIYASASYDCGGPYPTNDNNMSLTFDLKTGKVVAFQDLFKDYEIDKKQILKTIFSKQVAQTGKLATRQGKAKKPGGEEESCENDPSLFGLENLSQSEFAFNFARQGLQVQPQWPHVIEACAIRVTVPFNTLKAFASPTGILARALAP